ncbi:MAG: hypothetical protein J6570_06120 [Snodgrassella sp.]|nr:hypothetical protein [Snodgrassella sp.]
MGFWCFELIDIANMLYQYITCKPKDETPSKQEAESQASPLIIDLNFNGVETDRLGIGAYFDLDPMVLQKKLLGPNTMMVYWHWI